MSDLGANWKEPAPLLRSDWNKKNQNRIAEDVASSFAEVIFKSQLLTCFPPSPVFFSPSKEVLLSKHPQMLTSVLIANRGVCAARITRTGQRLGLRVVAVVVADDDAHAHAADAVVALPSYLDEAAIIAAAVAEGVDAVHPGYGFLAESESFARAVAAANLVFIGPSPDQMAAFATKHAARALAIEAGVPIVPGSGLVSSIDEARAAAAVVGYPVLLKSTAGGGGTGQAVVEGELDLEAAFDRVCRLADRLFRDGRVFVEAWVPEARHVEVQIFGTGGGTVVALGDRDCSAQRRNQKVLEEAPAPGLSPALRRAMSEAAVRLCERAGYVNAGTVEFLVDVGRGGDAFYFLEVNTRLQVEHAVRFFVVRFSFSFFSFFF